MSRPRLLPALALGVALITGIRGAAQGNDSDSHYQLGLQLFEKTRYAEALEAFRKATASLDESIAVAARIGLVKSALRIGEFAEARREAEALRTVSPRNAEALTAHADGLWSAGAFDEAEQEYRAALEISPDNSWAHDGLARALASRHRLEEAMEEAQYALRISPGNGEVHHTVGTIFERMRRYEQAAGAYTNYVNLLPKDRSEKAAWSRAQVLFLRAFGKREPIAIDAQLAEQLHTVDFRLVDDKVIVKARVNGQRLQDFVLDTGSERTTISRQTATGARVRPITYTLTAGVGETGLRGLQLARLDTLEIGTLKMSNVPVMIKAPALRGLPTRETESFSPLALGLSMTIDYAARKLTMGRVLPAEDADVRLPMRHHRLSLVRGLINGSHSTYFVVDTGGEVVSISTATAEALDAQPPRRIALRVYGTSGWDRDAFLLPGVDLKFDEQIDMRNYSVVVLNLRAPSILLGYEIGGILGHRFLSPYRVSLDLDRSEMRMSRAAK